MNAGGGVRVRQLLTHLVSVYVNSGYCIIDVVMQTNSFRLRGIVLIIEFLIKNAVIKIFVKYFENITSLAITSLGLRTQGSENLPGK